MAHATASTFMQPASGAHDMILDPVMTLEGHEKYIRSISFFSNGRRMISGSWDKTACRWDLRTGKEIEEARDVCEQGVWAVAVSRDGRRVVTGGGGLNRGELKGLEVETGIVKRFEGHSRGISCVDISPDSKLVVSGSWDRTSRIWNLGTGELVAGPFESIDWVGAVRFSSDSKKLAVKSEAGKCLEVWDVHTETLDVRIGEFGDIPFTFAPVFWTNKNKTIIAAFTFTYDDATTIYEFDALTLEIVGAPFEGHTKIIRSLALSSDGVLLASAAEDNTIKLWAFEPRQLLASFHVGTPSSIILSPNSRQLAYATGRKIYICNTPLDILISTRCVPEAQGSANADKNTNIGRLLNFHATRRPATVRRHPASSPAISFIHRPHRPPPTINPQQPGLLRHLREVLRFSSRTVTIPPAQNDQLHDRLDFPATSPISHKCSLSGLATTDFDNSETTSLPSQILRRSNRVTLSLRQHLAFPRSRRSQEPPVVEVAAGRKFPRLVAANLPEYIKVDDTRHPSSQQMQIAVSQDMKENSSSSESSDIDSLPDVHWCKAFFCYYSCWSHGRLRMPPRWRLKNVDSPHQDGMTSSGRDGARG